MAGAAAALVAVGLAASTPAGATPTSVEGNCLAAVTPTATVTDDGTTSSVRITWTDQCTNVSYYNIERSVVGSGTWTTVISGATFTRVLAPPSQNGDATDTPVPCGTYVYRVDAVHAPGNATPKVSISLTSNPVTVTVGTDCGGGGGGGGSQCTQLTGALTLGYYSNKNGQATLTDSDFADLTSLSLRNASGSDRDFTASLAKNKSDLRSWLLNATATNMSYMLSAQLATLELNIDHGVVSAGAHLCEVPGTPTIGDIRDAANQYLVVNPVVYGGSAARVDGDALQTLINEINNDLVSVS